MPTPSPIRDILLAIGEAIRAELLRLADANGKYPLRSNSKLKQTARVEVTQGRGTSGRFEGYTANSALQLYAEEYAVYLDAGRKPFTKKVPIAALVQFIKNRNLRLRDRQTGRFSRKRVTLKGKDGAPNVSVNQLAFMIQNAIYKNGIRGRHFIQPAFDLGQNLVEIYLDNQLLDSISYQLDRQLLTV
ncbi:hypothetical protein [Hymenobacter sp. YC55]|uniref:hypothetical protein n=1 Tax=Hymenobacter sp. YC55 TaxID=3034019 RepID=UPI0023F777F6|nr:hypothetical protein [Hymenobacter sp. YC55]MDF7810761.1 hypothetical protein [Hymenobacter sp. YC55]